MDGWQWDKVKSALKDVAPTTGGRPVLAVWPPPLEALLIELPVLDTATPPHHPLCGFAGEAVALLDRPRAADVAKLLHLEEPVVTMALTRLRRAGGATSDSAGRWHVPPGATQFRTSPADTAGPAALRRVRRLLCLWPEGEVVLPARPRLRLRDLVGLDSHRRQDEVEREYARCVGWSPAERAARGLTGVQLLPLGNPAPADDAYDRPVSPAECHAVWCRLEAFAVGWAARRDRVWVFTSRLWCRPMEYGRRGEPFTPGEESRGLTLLERLLRDGRSIDPLGRLFADRPDAWLDLLDREADRSGVRRDLGGGGPLLATDDGDAGWRPLPTTLSPHAVLLARSGDNGPTPDEPTAEG